MQNFLRDATEFLPILLQGVWLTILVTIGSLILSTVLGLFWALMRVSGVRALSGLSAGLQTDDSDFDRACPRRTHVVRDLFRKCPIDSCGLIVLAFSLAMPARSADSVE